MSRPLIALCVTALLAASAQAQTSRKVHRLEINNGVTQTVRYYGTGLTPAESSTLRDLERLENETYYARNLISLKKQYVNSENVLEPQRRQLQYQTIGSDITYIGFPALYGYGLANGYGYYGRGWAFPGYTYANWGPALASPVAAVYPAMNYGGYAGYAAYGAGGMDSPLKEAVAKTVAQQATPEYVAALERAFDKATVRASASPTLRYALDLPSPAEVRRERADIRAVAGEEDVAPAGPVSVLLRSGEKVVGKSMKESDGWVIVELVNGGRTRVRASEVVRIDERSTGGVVPAGGK